MPQKRSRKQFKIVLMSISLLTLVVLLVSHSVSASMNEKAENAAIASFASNEAFVLKEPIEMHIKDDHSITIKSAHLDKEGLSVSLVGTGKSPTQEDLTILDNHKNEYHFDSALVAGGGSGWTGLFTSMKRKIPASDSLTLVLGDVQQTLQLQSIISDKKN